MSETTKPNIGHLTSHISRSSGGVWEVVENLSLTLAETKSVNPSVWGLRDKDTDTITEKIQIPCSAFKTSGPKSIGYASDLLQTLKAADIDLMHTHGAWMYPSYASYHWGIEQKKPVIISPHGMLDEWALKNNRWKKKIVSSLFETKHMKKAHCLHALNKSEAEAIRKYTAPNPVCIIPNGINPSIKKTSAAEWVKELTQQKNTLLFLGRLAPQKGLDLLFNALAKMQRRNHPFILDWATLVVGQGQEKYTKKLRLFCEDNNLMDHVIFTGALYGQKKKEVLSTVDAFILPSYSEGLPVSVLEAWAHELPCILSANCNLDCGVTAGAALPIDLSIESISEQLENLYYMSSEEMRDMGKKGRTLAERDFSWQTVSEQMLDVYKWALGGGQLPSSVEII